MRLARCRSPAATTSSSNGSAGLPFEPTGDQAAAFAGIDEDLAREHPMQRLLMGEVGAGKTAVAVHAMLRAAGSGHQAALMAPTETLAEQHLLTLDRLLGGLTPIALLTGLDHRRSAAARFSDSSKAASWPWSWARTR